MSRKTHATVPQPGSVKTSKSSSNVFLSTLQDILTQAKPFFTQVSHQLYSKQAINPADFATIKIWYQSDHWIHGPSGPLELWPTI